MTLRLAHWLPISLLLLVAVPAGAHDPGLSLLTLELAPGALHARLQVNGADLDRVDRRQSPSQMLSLRFDNEPRVAREIRSRSEEGHIRTDFSFAMRPSESIEVEVPLLAALPFGHRQMVRLLDAEGTVLANRLLAFGDPPFRFAMDGAPAATIGFGRFLRLGAEHIALGFDHLLFLLALLIAAPALGAATRTVTAFTIAHSLTLAAATLGLVSLPPAVVEPAIAVSIIWVALRNVVGAPSEAERLGLTFGFGLVHGLGFAAALAELGLAEAGDVVVPLLAFNLGVEIGQLALAIAVLPLLHAAFRRRGAKPISLALGSLAIASLGFFWLLERILHFGFAP